jgi:UDPglucose 6-dehydrogenase
MYKNIGIIGNGFVGGATKQLECEEIKLYVYDIDPLKCVPKNLNLHDLNICDFIFVCVPTPSNSDKSCHTSIVENVVNSLKNINTNSYIIIRSTVPPGTSDKLDCYFMPEFLTEKNYIDDFINTKHWIIGSGKTNNINTDFANSFQELLNISHKYGKIKYNNLIVMSNTEAEIVKYTRNCFLSTKVAFFNEIYKLCEKLCIDYNSVRNGIICDERIGESHTQIPGHDGKCGYGGTCFPKDTNALNTFYKQLFNYEPPVLSSVIYRNENIDRPEKDWMQDKRAHL